MGQSHTSHSTNEVAQSHQTTECYTTSATTYSATLNEESPLFVPPDPRQQDEDQKLENNEIPDGGLVAWTQVLTGHLVVFNVWGYITS